MQLEWSVTAPMQMGVLDLQGHKVRQGHTMLLGEIIITVLWCMYVVFVGGVRYPGLLSSVHYNPPGPKINNVVNDSNSYMSHYK